MKISYRHKNGKCKTNLEFVSEVINKLPGSPDLDWFMTRERAFVETAAFNSPEVVETVARVFGQIPFSGSETAQEKVLRLYRYLIRNKWSPQN